MASDPPSPRPSFRGPSSVRRNRMGANQPSASSLFLQPPPSSYQPPTYQRRSASSGTFGLPPDPPSDMANVPPGEERPSSDSQRSPSLSHSGSSGGKRPSWITRTVVNRARSRSIGSSSLLGHGGSSFGQPGTTGSRSPASPSSASFDTRSISHSYSRTAFGGPEGMSSSDSLSGSSSRAQTPTASNMHQLNLRISTGVPSSQPSRDRPVSPVSLAESVRSRRNVLRRTSSRLFGGGKDKDKDKDKEHDKEKDREASHTNALQHSISQKSQMGSPSGEEAVSRDKEKKSIVGRMRGGSLSRAVGLSGSRPNSIAPRHSYIDPSAHPTSVPMSEPVATAGSGDARRGSIDSIGSSQATSSADSAYLRPSSLPAQASLAPPSPRSLRTRDTSETGSIKSGQEGGLPRRLSGWLLNMLGNEEQEQQAGSKHGSSGLSPSSPTRVLPGGKGLAPSPSLGSEGPQFSGTSSHVSPTRSKASGLLSSLSSTAKAKGAGVSGGLDRALRYFLDTDAVSGGGGEGGGREEGIWLMGVHHSWREWRELQAAMQVEAAQQQQQQQVAVAETTNNEHEGVQRSESEPTELLFQPDGSRSDSVSAEFVHDSRGSSVPAEASATRDSPGPMEADFHDVRLDLPDRADEAATGDHWLSITSADAEGDVSHGSGSGVSVGNNRRSMSATPSPAVSPSPSTGDLPVVIESGGRMPTKTESNTTISSEPSSQLNASAPFKEGSSPLSFSTRTLPPAPAPSSPSRPRVSASLARNPPTPQKDKDKSPSKATATGTGTAESGWPPTFQPDFSSRIWCTYRSQFTPISRDGDIHYVPPPVSVGPSAVDHTSVSAADRLNGVPSVGSHLSDYTASTSRHSAATSGSSPAASIVSTTTATYPTAESTSSGRHWSGFAASFTRKLGPGAASQGTLSHSPEASSATGSIGTSSGGGGGTSLSEKMGIGVWGRDKSKGLSTDSGWGCMLRTGQSLLANALVNVHLGRGWRRPQSPPVLAPASSASARALHDYARYVEILTWFFDDPAPHCAFSVHRMAREGKRLGKEVGEWFGPSTAAGAIKELANNFAAAGLTVSVAVDGVVYRSDVYSASCSQRRPNRSTLRAGGSEEEGSERQWEKPVLVLIGIRLGLDGVNPVYHNSIKAIFSWPQSVGVAGGRPSSSYYFIGVQGNSLFYLDPHNCRPTVPFQHPPDVESVRQPTSPSPQAASCPPSRHSAESSGRSAWTGAQVHLATPLSEQRADVAHHAVDPVDLWYSTAYTEQQLSTFHCEKVRRMPIRSLDPSMLVGFLCKTEEDFTDLCGRVKELGQKHKAIFSIADAPPKWATDDDFDPALESFSEPEPEAEEEEEEEGEEEEKKKEEEEEEEEEKKKEETEGVGVESDWEGEDDEAGEDVDHKVEVVEKEEAEEAAEAEKEEAAEEKEKEEAEEAEKEEAAEEKEKEKEKEEEEEEEEKEEEERRDR